MESRIISKCEKVYRCMSDKQNRNYTMQCKTFEEKMGDIIKRKRLFILVVIESTIMFLAGCEMGTIPNSMNNMDESDIDNTEDSTENSMPETGTDTIPVEIPQLPKTGNEFADFVPEDWKVIHRIWIIVMRIVFFTHFAMRTELVITLPNIVLKTGYCLCR